MKKNKIQSILHSKGYVSIEALIVAGLIIATGAFLTSKLVWKGKDVANSNNKNMINASKTMDDNSFSSNMPTDSSSQVQEAKHSVENPSDLSDFDYAIIDDNYINGELKKIDEKINNRPSDIPAPPPEVINYMKAPIQKLKEFNGGIIITGYHGNKSDIEIPSYIDGKEVTVIAPMAFAPKPPKPSELKEKNYIPEPPKGKLTSVKLPNTLKFIGDDAFEFNQLTEITIPDSVVEIGFKAFSNNKLTSIKLSDNLIRIEPFTFSDNKLKSVIIPDGVVEIGSNAFQNNNLTSINLGSNLKIIGPWAFSKNKLESVTTPDSVIEINDGVFSNNNLKSIKLGSNLKRIGTCAFNENQLELATVPDSVTEIDEFAFSSNKLKSIKLGSNLKRIGDFAFSDNKLESVIVPDSVTDLSDSAFAENPLKKKNHTKKLRRS
ncbi:leucine-rich repeat domain-containing protein [Clostridium perfringens]|uniref:Leucine-rich cell surface protein n=1 Tax=Clostridium perfringens TaxID=1502 RepID=A0A140GRW7_CLOPF|nr:leucine-rich repeat domain-containing protein [Clostridium perfringens]AMN31276.1 leucine-rich cell surface protein [Clostridium perfringens]